MGLTPELSYTIIVDRNVYIQLLGFVLLALLFFATQRGEAGTKGNFPNCCSDCQGERADFVGGGGGAGPLCLGPFSTGGRTAPAGPARSLRSAPLGAAGAQLALAGPGSPSPRTKEWKGASRRAHFVSPSVCVDAAAVGVCGLCTCVAFIITHKAL